MLGSLKRTSGCFDGLQCAVSAAAFALSPITDGLQQLEEGCDGRLVQALPSDAYLEDRRSSIGDAFLCADAA